MDRTLIEKRLAGARTEKNFLAPGPVSVNGAAVAKVRTLMVLDERCSGCIWTADCKTDRTCWKRERELLAEVGRYRRRERLGKLTGTEADVYPVSRATGRAHDVGSGENAHEWIGAVEWMVDEADRPIEIEVAEPLHPANQRLMDTLGVTVTVSTGSRKGAGPGPRWTREKAIEAIQAWAREHGHPPTGADALRNRALPSGPTCKRLGGWATLVEAAGFPRPTRGTRYKDSSGKGAVSQPDPRGHARPGDGGRRTRRSRV